MAPTLTNDEIEACREAFVKFDREGTGVIDSSELRATLQAMGQKPTEEELFDMIAELDLDRSGTIGARATPRAHARPPCARTGPVLTHLHVRVCPRGPSHPQTSPASSR